MRKLAFLLSACLLCLAARPSSLVAQGQGIIEGQVINATEGAPPESVVGLEVTLYEAVGDSRQPTSTTTSDPQGRFRFEGLNTGTEHTYTFQLEYQGVVYGTETTFPSRDTVLHVVVTIHETTASDRAIVVDRHHIIADFSGGALLIQEMCIFHNTSDTIYVGDGATTLRFSLPLDGESLTIETEDMESNFVQTDGGFASVRPLLPGQSEVSYSYSVPYDGTRLALSRMVHYPTASIDVMVAHAGVQVDSTQLMYRGLSGGGERAYLQFSAEDLAADTELELHVAGVPEAEAGRTVPAPSLSLALQEAAPIIALGMALLGALLPFAQQRLGQRPQPPAERRASGLEEPPVEDVGPPVQRDELLQMIASLDDAFAEGRLDQQGYQQLRNRMKKRLRDDWPE